MKIAVEGCAHGCLEEIYDTLELLQVRDNIKIDLLICCGDFQSTRNLEDLRCMAVPPKYYDICTFYKYYSGQKVAPVLTIFIGGNHEASNYLQELPYGGWVAPNIYYLGYAGVVNVAGLRIGGISGIYKQFEYHKGHYEIAPYNEDEKRSVYHVRSLEVFRLKQLSKTIDIFCSHDWPTNICHYGNISKLLRAKPFFEKDIESEKLGSKPNETLLKHLKPSYWFAAHLHCKFAALVPQETDSGPKYTKFLALDKCLPRRKFLQVLDIPHDPDMSMEIKYDLEWLTILYLTNHLLSVKKINQFMPGKNQNGRWNFTPTHAEKDFVLQKFDCDLVVPKNFIMNAPVYDPKSEISHRRIQQPEAHLNPQTKQFCEKLGIDDPVELLMILNNPVRHKSLVEILNSSMNFEHSLHTNTEHKVNEAVKLPDQSDSQNTTYTSFTTDADIKENDFSTSSSSDSSGGKRKLILTLPEPKNTEVMSFSASLAAKFDSTFNSCNSNMNLQTGNTSTSLQKTVCEIGDNLSFYTYDSINELKSTVDECNSSEYKSCYSTFLTPQFERFVNVRPEVSQSLPAPKFIEPSGGSCSFGATHELDTDLSFGVGFSTSTPQTKKFKRRNNQVTNL